MNDPGSQRKRRVKSIVLNLLTSVRHKNSYQWKRKERPSARVDWPKTLLNSFKFDSASAQMDLNNGDSPY